MQTPLVNALYIVVGVLGAGWVLNDIFKQVLLPRAVSDANRLSVFFARFAWHIARRIGNAIRDAERREDLLGMLAPLYFVIILAIWLFALALCYGLILYGLRDGIVPQPKSYFTAVYFAGTSLLTIGYGDFVATSGWARAISLFAGASGIGTVAVAITFLYAIIAAFQQRERFVVALDARAGAPPSGVALLETYGALALVPDLDRLFRESERWVADVLDSHLAYPILMSFRSSHRDESWIGALGALLDAAALIVYVTDGVPSGEARLFLDIGMHLTHDMVNYFDLFGHAPPPSTADERATIRRRLGQVGIVVSGDADRWARFDQLRASYAQALDGIGHRWLSTTAPLIGERTALPGHGV